MARALLPVFGILHGGGALAAPPLPYSGWQVINGRIDTTASCSAPNVTCTTIVQDNGFLQERLDLVGGGTFIRTIITDKGANGGPEELSFDSETFSPVDKKKGKQRKIDSRTTVRDGPAGFVSTATISHDPFEDQSGSVIDVHNVDVLQTLANIDMTDSFHLVTNSVTGFPDPASDTQGRLLDHISDVRLNDALCNVVDPTCDPTWASVQRFVNAKREGWYGEVVAGALAVNPYTPAGAMTLGGVTVDWVEGDRVGTTWIAQMDNRWGTTATYALQTVENLDATTGNPSAGVDATDAPLPLDPFDWDAGTFGPPPPSLQ